MRATQVESAAGRGSRGGILRTAGVLFAIGGLVWVGWQVIANTAADGSVNADPTAALAWRPDSAAALGGLAAERLESGATSDVDLASVSALAAKALLVDPVETDALKILGLVADIGGNSDQANALMSRVASRSLRDTGAEFWLLDRNVRTGDAAAAISNADAILRTQSSLADQVYPALLDVAQDAQGEAPLLAALQARPPWRLWFLQQLARTPDELPTEYDLLDGLAAGPTPPMPNEIGSYLQALIGGGSYELAFLTWLHFLPPDEAQRVPFVYNGDFEKPISGLPFDWQITDVHGADTEVVETADKGVGKALRVVFSNTRVAYHHVTKLLVLPPGPYELSGMIKAEGLVTPRGMRWRIACSSGNSQQLGESDAYVGTFGWKSFTVSFTVPATGCPAQTLRLELDTRVALDQQVVGTFWSDGLVLNRVDITSPSD